MQGGTRFTSATTTKGVFTSTAWETATRDDITAQAAGNANFSAAGAPLQFGYYRSNMNNGAAAQVTTHGIDNWRVEICRVRAQ